MRSRPESDEALVKRLIPSANPDPEDRTRAWAEWHECLGGAVVLRFIRAKNTSAEPDEDILQDSLMTAYMEVERGRYEQRQGIPFTAYVKGIARNKIREARRRSTGREALDDVAQAPSGPEPRPLENTVEYREERAALWQGLAQLPLPRRQVLEAYLRGESMSEIADRLAITEDLVRQHKHRGLQRLQQMELLG
jgi:RNA polymerase sigma-70 factor (ECF subfamily)